ncbi:MAG: cupin domain-containing protein, partial [Candidatus Enteromonas sp.]|nr:cupin domain-containing protein [Candidatus Enteromonas sp.]
LPPRALERGMRKKNCTIISFIYVPFFCPHAQGECLPEHFSNAENVYITIVCGTLSATLNEQETHEYQAGTVLKIPFHTKMNLRNLSEETLEFIVVKAPAPNC